MIRDFEVPYWIRILDPLARQAELEGNEAHNIAIVLYALLGAIRLGSTHELARLCQGFARGELTKGKARDN